MNKLKEWLYDLDGFFSTVFRWDKAKEELCVKTPFSFKFRSVTMNDIKDIPELYDAFVESHRTK